MNRKEAIRKLKYSKKAYQMLIDEKVDSGKLVGKDVKGEWEADTPLDEAYKSMIDALEMAIKALEQEPKWISVSERLPEEYGEYLITWTGLLGANSTERTKPLIGIAEYEIYEPENYEDWITTDYEFRHYHDIKVLAWMPLPEPYKAESEG